MIGLRMEFIQGKNTDIASNFRLNVCIAIYTVRMGASRKAERVTKIRQVHNGDSLMGSVRGG